MSEFAVRGTAILIAAWEAARYFRVLRKSAFRLGGAVVFLIGGIVFMVIGAGLAAWDKGGQFIYPEFISLASGGICGWLGILMSKTPSGSGGRAQDQSPNSTSKLH
jgi:hypothetical protein